MQRKSLVVLVVILLVILVISVIVYSFTRPQRQTAAQAMALRGNDIGPGWTDNERYDPTSYPDESSSVSWNYWLHNESGDLSIESSIIQFNTTEGCNWAYEWLNSTLYEYVDEINYSMVTLGDKAIHIEINYPPGSDIGYPEYMFMRGNVLCIMWFYPNDEPFVWMNDVLHNIAQLQLEKIDQYLMEHPRAD